MIASVSNKVVSPFAPPLQAPTGPAIEVEAASPEAPVEAGSGVGRKLGLAALAGLSLLGAAGCATTAYYPRPTSPEIFCGTSRRCSTVADSQMLRVLGEQKRLFEVRSADDSDDFGRPLTATQAMALLDSGKPIVVQSGTVGRYDDFRSFAPITPDDIQQQFVGEGVFIDSYDDLQVYNAMERATSIHAAASPLNAEQSRAAAALRFFEGGIAGGQVREQVDYQPPEMDPTGHRVFPGIPNVYWRYSSNDPSPALYSQQQKGGILGLGTHQDRITAFEGYKELKAGRPVTIHDRHGDDHTVRSLEELETLYQHELNQ